MAAQPPGEMKPCHAPGRNGSPCGRPVAHSGLCHSHADWQREHPGEPLQPLRERHEERRRLVQVRLTADELDAVDDVVERGDGPSRGEVIRQCVRQVLLPERAAAEGRLSGAMAAAEVVAEGERRRKK